MDNLVALTEAALKLVAEAQDLATLDNVRVEYLGKKGSISALMKNLGQLTAAERPAAGAEINTAKDKVQDAIAERKALLEHQAVAAKLSNEVIDVTLPGRSQQRGDRKSTRLNSSHVKNSYAVFCLKKKSDTKT